MLTHGPWIDLTVFLLFVLCWAQDCVETMLGPLHPPCVYAVNQRHGRTPQVPSLRQFPLSCHSSPSSVWLPSTAQSVRCPAALAHRCRPPSSASLLGRCRPESWSILAAGRRGCSLTGVPPVSHFVCQAHRFRRFGRSSVLLYMYSPFLLATRGRAYYFPSRADRWPSTWPNWIVDRLKD